MIKAHLLPGNGARRESRNFEKVCERAIIDVGTKPNRNVPRIPFARYLPQITSGGWFAIQTFNQSSV